MVVEAKGALDMEDVDTFVEEESNARQQMIASTNDHPSLPRNDEKLDLPQDDATKSQSATTETSSKKDKQNRSRRRRSSLGLSAAEHIAMEEQKSTITKKRASAMTLSATDLMGANADISRSSSTMAASPDQKTKRGKAPATTRSADATRIEKLDHGNKSDVQEPTGNAVRSTVESTGDNIQDLVQQKDYRSVWKAAAREAVATATNNEEGTNQNRKETDRSDGDNSDTDDDSADARRLGNLLASKQEGWQQQAWLAALAAARHHNHHHHHHGQHHGKRHSSAMNQSATDHIKMDAPVALSTMNLFGGVHGRRASNSSRAPSA